MCYDNCRHTAPDGSCAWNLPGPRPCQNEPEGLQTDCPCPLCLEAGRNNSWLHEAADDAFHCPACEVTYPAAEWLELLGSLLCHMTSHGNGRVFAGLAVASGAQSLGQSRPGLY